jgi:hypothetical protein
MADMLDVYGGPPEPEMSCAELDADAIRDTPYQGALRAAEHTSGICFSHENADAWKLLRAQMSPEAYEALRNSVVERVGEFEEKTPEAGVDYE